MLGRDDEWASTLERAYQVHLGADEPVRAVRCAFWLSLNLALRGETARATGWLGRARRLLEHEPRDCVEHGYLLIPVAAQQEATGEFEAAYATAGAAASIGERFADADLLAIAVHEQGNVLVKHGRVEQGLALLDEAMVAVTAGELSPIVTGLVYCSVIAGCQEVHAVGRARQWTEALTRWCDQQPDMVAFTGRCRLHRAEIMELHGSWQEALEEARRAGERCALGTDPRGAAEALYREGELHRLQGHFAAAERAYRNASLHGCEPQPGLALLRLTQGNADAAAAAIRRVMSETSEPLRRVRLLPACVEIMLAIGEQDEARGACAELERIAAAYDSGVVRAMVSHAQGAVELAGGDIQAALVFLREACRAWQDLEAPYDAARARVLLGLACRALGDEDAAALELEAAHAVFERLGAAPDLARLDRSPTSHGLTKRELEVLRLVASGVTNKAIAAELVLSERTVDRHVSNILSKLRVSSRVAATAYAYEHELV